MARVTPTILLLVSVAAFANPLPVHAEFEIASFSADVTIPIGHRCMGILPTKSVSVLDPLFAHGFVLLGGERPIVLVALDWCEIRNGSYDQWRDALAEAAGTSRDRVLLSALHQHDAPVIDGGAAALLRGVGLEGELFDELFHDDAVRRVSQALHDSLASRQPVTHVGLGKAVVNNVASNRRVVDSAGQVTFQRGSRSGGDPIHRAAPEGLIDKYLRTISFWNGGQPLVALHAYATHPMSSYGQGQVSADFVGLARARRQRDDFSIKQIYVTGCSGDVTAGKYNTGSAEDRVELIDKMYQAMVRAWEDVDLHPLEQLAFRNSKLELAFHPGANLTEQSLNDQLRDPRRPVEQRILAAMGLSSRSRVAARQPIDVPCVDLGPAQIVLFPGEAFVGYQLHAQRMRPDSFVFSIGYGECWTGYIPTEAAFADHFGDSWLWVAPGAEARIHAGLKAVLLTE
jgi:hypothetical protein